MKEISKPGPNGALSEILAATGELDLILSGRGLQFSRAPEPPAPPPPLPLYIPPFEEEGSSFVDPPEPVAEPKPDEEGTAS